MKPVLLHYYITNRCNARCSFCDIWRRTPKQDAALEDVTKNLCQARKQGCKFVDFTGGEPLLHPHLPEFLKQARKLGFFTSVTTNCILFEKRAHELRGLIDLLHFSLDGGTAQVHDPIRGVASFDAVMRSIPRAIDLKMYPDLLFTYTDENIGSFPQVAAIAKHNKLVAILDPVFETSGADGVSAHTHHLAMEFSRIPGVYLNRAHLELRREGGNNRTSPRCKAVSSAVVILPDNTLALPCFHHTVNSIALQGGLSDALNGAERAKALRNQGRYEFCEACHINCYFDPSYTATVNRLTAWSLRAKISYAWTKYILYRRRLPLRSFFG